MNSNTDPTISKALLVLFSLCSGSNMLKIAGTADLKRKSRKEWTHG